MLYNRLIKDSILYIPAKVLPAVTTMFLLAILFRTLIAADFINYSLISTICLVSTQLSSGWLTNSILFFLPTAESPSIFLINVIRIVIATSTLGILVAVGILNWNAFSSGLIIGAAFLMLGQTAFYLLSSVFQSRGDIATQLLAVTVQCLITVSVVLVSKYLGNLTVSMAITASAVGFLFGSTIYIVRILPLLSGSKDLSRFFRSGLSMEIVTYGVPLGLWTCFMLISNSSDRFFLKSWSNAAAAASYLSGKDLLVGAAGLVTMPLLMASHPMILQLGRTAQWEQAKVLIYTNIALLIAMFSVYITILIFVGPFLLTSMFGAGYSPNIIVLSDMLFGLLFATIAMYLQKKLEVEGRTRKMAGYAAVAATAGVGFSATLIPAFGVTGAAFSYVLSNFLYMVLVGHDGKYGWTSFSIPRNVLPGVGVMGLGAFCNMITGAILPAPEHVDYYRPLLWCAFFIPTVLIVLVFGYVRLGGKKALV